MNKLDFPAAFLLSSQFPRLAFDCEKLNVAKIHGDQISLVEIIKALNSYSKHKMVTYVKVMAALIVTGIVKSCLQTDFSR